MNRYIIDCSRIKMQFNLWLGCIAAGLMIIIFIYVILWNRLTDQRSSTFFGNMGRKIREMRLFRMCGFFKPEESSDAEDSAEEQKKMCDGKKPRKGKDDGAKKENKTASPLVYVRTSEMRTVRMKNHPPHFITLDVIRVES